jgi:hypothetical protein
MLRPIRVHSHDLRFYLDSPAVQRSAGLEARLARCEAALARLPPEHIRMIVEPIIVVDALAGGRRTGGGWYPPASAAAGTTVGDWLGERNALNTGVPASEVLARVGGREGSGIIAVTAAAFLRDENWGIAREPHPAHEFTLLHEVAHSVDFHSSLIPPASLAGRGGHAPYQGQSYPEPTPGELAAEAYSRFFLRPSAMCRGGEGTPPCLRPDGTRTTGHCPSQRRCSARMQRDLQSTAAFRMIGWEFPLARAPGVSGDEARRTRHASGDRASGHLPDTLSPSQREAVNPLAGWRRRGPFGVA